MSVSEKCKILLTHVHHVLLHVSDLIHDLMDVLKRLMTFKCSHLNVNSCPAAEQCVTGHSKKCCSKTNSESGHLAVDAACSVPLKHR